MTLFDLPAQVDTHDNTNTFIEIPLHTALEKDFPSVQLSKLGIGESWRKEVHRPATSTHKWWAKRLGSVFRGILMSAITSSADDAMRAYSSNSRLSGLVVFDPFAGSGTTVVEAAKVGASAIGWDINPVATLVQRQAVTQWDASELQRLYTAVEKSCRSEIDRVHRTESGETALYYFWVAVGTCNECSHDIRLFSSHVFSKHAYPKRTPEAQIVCPKCLDILSGRHDFTSTECSGGHRINNRGSVSRSMATCYHCGGSSKTTDLLNGKPPRYEMYAKLVLTNTGQKRYEKITQWDRDLYAECTKLAMETPGLVAPSGTLEAGINTRQAMAWGFAVWKDFFNDRQLYSLGLLASTIRNLSGGEPEREALTALFSGILEFNNMFCSFKGEGTGAVRHMFSHHILKPERTPLEAHPWGTSVSSGSFSTLFKTRLLRAHEYKQSPFDQILVEGSIDRVFHVSRPFATNDINGHVNDSELAPSVLLRTGDASTTGLDSESVDLVVTDPPYMDNVHYSELADFFHSWLRQMQLRDYPSSSSTRHMDEVQSASADDFAAAIARVWRECHRVLKHGGLLAFTFHQARTSGWAALVRSLAEAGFVVTALQPVHGEMSTSVTKYGAEPSSLDSIVVCRKREYINTPSRLNSTSSAALESYNKLLELRASALSVGVGDIRSVIRGRVLSVFTESPESFDLEKLSIEADQIAQSYVDRFNQESQDLQAPVGRSVD